MDPGTPLLGKVRGLMDHGLVHVRVAFQRTWCTPVYLDGKKCLVHPIICHYRAVGCNLKQLVLVIHIKGSCHLLYRQLTFRALVLRQSKSTDTLVCTHFESGKIVMCKLPNPSVFLEHLPLV